MSVKIHPKYLPLYQLLDGHYPQIDTVIITGGRYSAKSFNIGLWSVIALVQYDWSVLFARYTNTSIVDSIKPNVDDKIELMNYQPYVINTATHIEKGSNRIAFKGVKTGSSQQTANLKSLENFNAFVVDEADEMPDFDTFEKVYLSIRSFEKRNISILSLNPGNVQHWIFKKFYKPHGLKGGENTIIDNVMYIHTSYLDIERQFIPKNFLTYYQKLKESDIKRYNHIVLGQWKSEAEGQVFKDFKQITYQEYVNIESLEHYSIDFGAEDPMAIISWKFVQKPTGENAIYFHERWYKSENKTRDEMPVEYQNQYKKIDGGILKYIVQKVDLRKDRIILCDQGGSVDDYKSNNFKINAIQSAGWTKAIPAPKQPGSIHFGVQLLQNIDVYYTIESDNIDYEVNNYTLDSDREGFIEGKYIDKFNHTIDACRNVAYYLFKLGLLKGIN